MPTFLTRLFKPSEEHRGKGVILPLLASVYLLTPGLIFLLGWTKWFWALLAVAVFIPSLIFLWKHLPSIRVPFPKTWKDAAKFIGVACGLFLLVRFSGIGNMAAITKDLEVRNTIFEILVRYDWPVRYATDPGYVMGYYIGFWLPAALAGKLFGLGAGYAFVELWSFAGLFLVYLFICALHKKIVVWPLVVFVFFSGMDVIPELIALGMGRKTAFVPGAVFPHLEWHHFDNFSFNMLSNVTNIYWIYNNTIPVWVACMLLLFVKDNRISFIVFASLLLSSLLSAAGLVPVILLLGFTKPGASGSLLDRKFVSKSEIWPRLKEFFSIENLTGGIFLSILSVAFLYVTPDPNQVTSNGVGMYFYLVSPKDVVLWIVAILCEFAIFVLLCLKRQWRNPLFHLTWVCLLFFPVFFVGLNQDFCMKATVPYLMLLCLFLSESVQAYAKAKKKVLLVASLAMLAIGAVTPLFEILRQGKATFELLYGRTGTTGAQVSWIILECVGIGALFCLVIFALRPWLLKDFGRSGRVYRLVFAGCSIFMLVGLSVFMTSHFNDIPLAIWNEQVSVYYIISGPNFTHTIAQDLFYRVFAR